MKTKTAAFTAANIPSIDNTKLQQISKVSMDKIKDFINVDTSFMGNIPEELVQQPRWVKLVNGVPIRNWNNPANQTFFTAETMAFDISSHSSEYPDYLLMDWDDVYDPDTNKFTSELAEKTFYWVLTNLPVTYVELSKSKHGFHILLKPTGLQPITNSSYNVIKFTDNSKLEMFYKNKARLVVLTGYSLGEKIIGKAADEFLINFLSEIHQYNGYKSPNEEQIKLFTFEQDQIRAKKMLEYIPITQLSRADWRAVIRCWKDLQLPFDVIDKWSQADSRYNDGNDADMFTTWDAMEPGNPDIAIKTLCNWADKYGGYNSQHHWDSKFWRQFQCKNELTEQEHIEIIRQFVKLPTRLTEKILISAAYLSFTTSSSDLVIQFKSACKKLGITLSELNQRLNPIKKKVQKQITEKLYEQKQNAAEKKFKQLGLSCPVDLNKITFPDNLIPNWINKTLEQITNTGCIEKFDSIPLITEHLYDPISEEYYTTLQILNHLADDWKTLSVPRNYLMSTKMVELSSKGLNVTQWNCKQLSEYFCKFEQLNNTVIVTKTLVYQPGWENTEFIIPQKPNKNYGLTSEMSQAINKDFSCSGKISESAKLIAKLKTSPYTNFALGTVLASSVVGIIGCENIHVHLYGKANSGKSVLFNAVFSILGNPNVPGVIPTSKTSLAGLEFYLAARRDLPAMIDDLNTANNEELKPVLHDLIMGFGNGVGKLRGNLKFMLNHTYQMRGSLLTNAEKMITDDFSNSGSKRRVIELMVPEVLIDSTLAEKIINTTKQHYGLFFSEWVDYLQFNQSTVIQVYKTNLDWLMTNYNTKVERQLHAVAAIITANQLFSQLFLNKSDCLENYVEILDQLADFSTMSDTYRVVQMIKDWYQANSYMFVPNTHVPNKEHYGFITNKYIAVYPQVFDSLLKSWGFHISTIKHQLQNEGFLQKSSGKNLNVTIILKNGENIRMVKIFLDKLNN